MTKTWFVLRVSCLALLCLSVHAQEISGGGGGGGSSEVSADIDSDLVNHWAMEDDSCLTDAGSGEDNLTLTGSPTCATSGGAVGDDYLVLNGSSQYGSADITWPSGDFTIALWVNADTGNSRFAWAGHDGSDTSAELGVQIPADPNQHFAVNYNQSSALISVPIAQYGVWMHWAVTREANVIKAWVNGREVGAMIAAATLSFSTCDFLLGYEADTGCAAGPGNYWDGGIDDVRIYTRALSATDLLALYALGD